MVVRVGGAVTKTVEDEIFPSRAVELECLLWAGYIGLRVETGAGAAHAAGTRVTPPKSGDVVGRF
jgi:hypothetical protein